jgi:osmoprotectant transport system permease protein
MINSIFQWLTDSAQWSGPDGIPTRVLEHLEYSVVTLLIAAAIAIPVGLFVGHTGRGRFLVSVANSLRAVPTLGLLFAISLWIGPKIHGSLAFVIPSIVVLVLLAIPPILSGTYAGIEGVDPDARDAAKGMGMRGSEALFKVELPCALPLVMSGLRSAALQVIATATIASSVSLGGLGRYLIDGLANSEYEVMAGGAVCVAALAVLVDLLMAGLQRAVVSPGLTGKFTSSAAVARTVSADPT